MNALTRVAHFVRQKVGFFPGLSMDQLSPFDERNDKGFGLIRGQDPAQYKQAGETIRLKGFETNAVVNACVRVIADQIGIAHLEAYTIGKDGTIELHPDHQLQQLLDQPAPQMPGFSFRRMAGLQVVMYGNSYFPIVRDTRGVAVGLRNVHPARLDGIVVNEADEIVEWQWSDSRGRQRHTAWDDMLHVKDHAADPDGWFGFPRGLAALQSMVTDGEASTYVRQTLGNSGVPALVFFGRQGAGQEELKEAEARWHERMVMNGERGRTRFVGGVESLQVIGHTLKDLEFPSLRQVSREDICAAFGVDPRLIGVGSAKGNEGGLSGSQYQEARRRLEQQTCQPIRMAVQEALDSIVTPEFGFYYARFSPEAIAAIIETPTEVAQRCAVLVASTIITLDDARRLTGFPEAMDPTHITTAKMLQTVAEALQANQRMEAMQDKALAAKTTASAQKGASVSEQVGGPSGITDANNNSGRSDSVAPATRQSPAPTRLRLAGRSHASAEDVWAASDAQATALEPLIEHTISRAVSDTTLQILAALNRAHGGTVQRSASDPWWMRFEAGLLGLFGADAVVRNAWLRMLSADLNVHATRIADQFAEQAGREFDSGDARFTAGMRTRWSSVADHATQQIAQRVAETVSTARAASLSGEEVAGIFLRMNWTELVERTAATESVGLINHAERIAAEQLSLKKKRWLERGDGLTRPSHVTCSARGWIDMGQAFPNGLQFAHDPRGSAEEILRCRCFTLYADSEDATQ